MPFRRPAVELEARPFLITMMASTLFAKPQGVLGSGQIWSAYRARQAPTNEKDLVGVVVTDGGRKRLSDLGGSVEGTGRLVKFSGSNALVKSASRETLCCVVEDVGAILSSTSEQETALIFKYSNLDAFQERSLINAFSPSPTSALVPLLDFTYLQQSIYVAISTLLVYDAVIHMDSEVKHFWKQPWQKISLLFFANRYIGILGAFSRLPMDSINVSTNLNLFWFGSIANLITIVTVDYVLLLRVCAMYSSGSRNVSILLKVLLLIEALIRLGMIIYTRPRLEISVVKLVTGGTTCRDTVQAGAISGRVPILNWSFSMIYGIIIIALTINKAIKFWKTSNVRTVTLINSMVRDQAIYFFILTICCTMCIVEDVINLQNNVWNAILLAIGSTSYLSLLGCRMLVHLKEFGSNHEQGAVNQNQESLKSLSFAGQGNTSATRSVLIVEGKWEDSVYYVEDVLFRILREDLEGESEVLRDMFNEGGKPRGLSDEEPLVLADVKRDEFRVFLKARRPDFQLVNEHALLEEELVTALTLSDRWHLVDMRQLIIERMERLNLPSARKLQLARNHKIHQWYRGELLNLARRDRWLNLEEAQQLGLELTVVVGGLRGDKRTIDARLNEYITMDTFGLSFLRTDNKAPSPHGLSPRSVSSLQYL
ncbi:hypothetical protein PNOK_0416000 [Pyrrhoderma noxium]|uniref:DUF6533 domain-containing protein n=1 Tax=Pyrrhoderma noxium TaxID=2282107 RepID=A0A286UI14_9AGAM|nr:hypothetical protein PNOK_0416000 [Pyrrhoderma noxium]